MKNASFPGLNRRLPIRESGNSYNSKTARSFFDRCAYSLKLPMNLLKFNSYSMN